MTGTITSGERSIAREALQARAARAAGGLAGLEIGAGDAVAILLRNDLAFLEASLAARMLGAYAVPINWHSTGEEAAYVLAVETPPELRETYGPAPAACRIPAGVEGWEHLIASAEPLGEPATRTPASMIYTSGTTGRPKGVRREPATPEQLKIVLGKHRQVFGINPGMRAIIPAPLYHSAPNAFAVFSLLTGGDLVLLPRFAPERFLALVERHRITHVQMVPTMFIRLLKLPEPVRSRYDVSSLEHVVHAAAPCPVEVKRAMIEWWGPVIHEYYGSTESGAVTFCNSEEYLSHPGTVGRPMANCTVRILDGQGRALPQGEVGEIYARDPTLPDFTYHGLDAKRREMERDGLITSGDMGYLDAEGYLYLCDRKIDMVISGGVNIYPAEVEAVLLRHPQVRDCAVFGIPDEEFGETLAAAVQPNGAQAPQASELQAYLREHLAAFKVPRLIEVRADLPREDSGKIFKRKLRAPYWEKAGRAI
jgi:long-chain acyl-CoA synthetase